MPIEATRRGFLAGLLGTAVVAVLPSTPYAAVDPWDIRPPEGITYQWVRTALLGVPDPDNVQKRLDNGWTFVVPTVHPGAPTSTLEQTIAFGGLVLMAKPTPAVQEDWRRAQAAIAENRANKLPARGRATTTAEIVRIPSKGEMA